MNSNIFLIASLWLIAIAIIPSTNGYYKRKEKDTSLDYSPCKWEQGDDGPSVVCDKVSISQIKELFSRKTSRDLESFILTTSSSETVIPQDLLGDSRASALDISCNEATNTLIIDEDAFRSSKSFIKSVSILKCDLRKQPDFSFLSDFESLESLAIANSKNFNSFKGIPSSSKLISVDIRDNQGFENLAADPKIALPRLQRLYFMGNQLNDEAIAKLLRIFTESSKDTLQELKIDHNKLTRVPDATPSFRNLTELRLENNLIKKIHTRSLVFSNRVNFLDLEDNFIETIEPNAFGDGRFNQILLMRNNLTRFESYVFKVVLEQMAGPNLIIAQNPFECDCHLAWLIVHNRHLMPFVEGGICSNSTNFNDLDPKAFRNCPVFTCPDRTDGNFPNPLSCSSYYRCVNGKSYLLECPRGRAFSPLQRNCDSADKVPTCRNRSL